MTNSSNFNWSALFPPGVMCLAVRAGPLSVQLRKPTQGGGEAGVLLAALAGRGRLPEWKAKCDAHRMTMKEPMIDRARSDRRRNLHDDDDDDERGLFAAGEG